jgi:hypothetical protein
VKITAELAEKSELILLAKPQLELISNNNSTGILPPKKSELILPLILTNNINQSKVVHTTIMTSSPLLPKPQLELISNNNSTGKLPQKSHPIEIIPQKNEENNKTSDILQVTLKIPTIANVINNINKVTAHEINNTKDNSIHHDLLKDKNEFLDIDVGKVKIEGTILQDDIYNHDDGPEEGHEGEIGTYLRTYLLYT